MSAVAHAKSKSTLAATDVIVFGAKTRNTNAGRPHLKPNSLIEAE
jgi:hypothetical protein